MLTHWYTLSSCPPQSSTHLILWYQHRTILNKVVLTIYPFVHHTDPVAQYYVPPSTEWDMVVWLSLSGFGEVWSLRPWLNDWQSKVCPFDIRTEKFDTELYGTPSHLHRESNRTRQIRITLLKCTGNRLLWTESHVVWTDQQNFAHLSDKMELCISGAFLTDPCWYGFKTKWPFQSTDHWQNNPVAFSIHRLDSPATLYSAQNVMVYVGTLRHRLIVDSNHSVEYCISKW